MIPTAHLFDQSYYAGIWETVHRHDYAHSLASRLIETYGCCRMLDVGSGCGFLVRTLRERGCDAWGVEISEHALQNRCSEYLVPGDVRDLHFRDGYFDVVHSNGLWEYVPECDVPQAVTEVLRVGRKQEHAIDTAECRIHPEFRAVTIKPRAWWDKQLLGPKILIACPNHECKEYAFRRWIKAVEAIDWPNKEVLVVDNSPTLDFLNRWKYCVPMIHLDLSGDGPNRRIALSMEYIRKHFLASDAAWWLNLESDVIPPPHILQIMISASKGYDWVSHNYPSRNGMQEMMSGFGCTLFSRNIMQETFADAPADNSTDGWWWNTKIMRAGYPTFESWHLLDLEHLSDPNAG